MTHLSAGNVVDPRVVIEGGKDQKKELRAIRR
jgi:hypothetical protein